MGTPTLLSSSSTPTLLLSRHFSRAPAALNYTTDTQRIDISSYPAAHGLDLWNWKYLKSWLTISGESKEIQEERYAIFSLSEMEAGRKGKCAESNLCLLTFRSPILKIKINDVRNPSLIYCHKLNTAIVLLFTKVNIGIGNNFWIVVWVWAWKGTEILKYHFWVFFLVKQYPTKDNVHKVTHRNTCLLMCFASPLMLLTKLLQKASHAVLLLCTGYYHMGIHLLQDCREHTPTPFSPAPTSSGSAACVQSHLWPAGGARGHPRRPPCGAETSPYCRRNTAPVVRAGTKHSSTPRMTLW